MRVGLRTLEQAAQRAAADSFSSEQMGHVEVGIAAGGCSADGFVWAVVRGCVLVVAVDEVGAGDGFGGVALMPFVSLSLAVESSLMSTDGSCDFLSFCPRCLRSAFDAGLFTISSSFCLFFSCITDVKFSISSPLSVDASSGIG